MAYYDLNINTDFIRSCKRCSTGHGWPNERALELKGLFLTVMWHWVHNVSVDSVEDANDLSVIDLTKPRSIHQGLRNKKLWLESDQVQILSR